MPPENNF